VVERLNLGRNRSAKDLNGRELVLFNLSNYLTNQTITSVQLEVTPRRSDTFGGELLVLSPNYSNSGDYVIVDSIPLVSVGAGTHTIDLTTPGTAVALNVLSGSVKVGVELGV
jgi:hypothetical protein